MGEGIVRLEVLGFALEVALRTAADGATLGCRLAVMHISALTALPVDLFDRLECHAGLHVVGKACEALFVGDLSL